MNESETYHGSGNCCEAEGNCEAPRAREYWIAGLALASGAALGAAAMYLCDPDRGKARRTRIQDKAASAARQTGRQFVSAAEDVLNRARGVASQAGAAVSCHADIDDDVLKGRVRSHLGHVTRHAHTIETLVKDGRVTLRGILPDEERSSVVDKLQSISGVRQIEDQLACALTS